jgi:uncharacterized membrane protein
MNKFLSRTYWLIVGMIALVTCLLIYKYVTDIIWQGVAMGCVLAWVGNDVANKWKKPDEPK